MLENWNFRDEVANSTFQQINRQKSARNLEVLQFDPSEPRAVFFDPRRNNRHTATLRQCDCKDFSRAGTAARKALKPCMHIYRLAMELDLIEPKYLDHRARYALAAELARAETERLQVLARDSTQWGGWARSIHDAGTQRNRQYRAYSLIEDEPAITPEFNSAATIHGYFVSLDDCDCMDFIDRHLPCKHIYVVALLSKLAIPLSEPEFRTAKEKGLEIISEFRQDPQ
ncbi:MAG: SWIM zinc finger domain-containing protein [Verrucomicrobiota bacterium]|nr:SWIM zinc finger domain-containing protein [Verrucomicrobiota bacterium]